MLLETLEKRDGGWTLDEVDRLTGATIATNPVWTLLPVAEATDDVMRRERDGRTYHLHVSSDPVRES